MEYTFSKEDIKFVERAIQIRNNGYYMDGGKLTTVYNRVLHKNVNVTNCGTCMRGRITELETALNHYKKLMESSQEPSKDVEVDNVSPDENNANTEEKKRVGRPKKK